MRGHCEVSKNPQVAAHTSCLLPYKHFAPVSPLECAVTGFCVTVHSKRLTQRANSFGMRSYIKTRGRVPARSRLPHHLLLERKHAGLCTARDDASFPIWHASSLRRMLLLVQHDTHGSLPPALFPFSIFTFPFS